MIPTLNRVIMSIKIDKVFKTLIELDESEVSDG